MQSDHLDVVELEQRAIATERLLGALIAVLAAREPETLRQLQAIFARSDFAADPAGRAAASSWARISSELKEAGLLIDSLGVGGSSH